MDKQNSSYKQIVKSTSIFGGVQLVNIIIGFLRTKVAALLLATEGIGIIAMCQTILDLIRSISSLGINTGGVRNIASLSNDKDQQVYTISVFRWWVMLTSCLGSLICLLFCYPISVAGFGDGSYSIAIALLSIAIFFTTLSFGQSTILQGLRMITIMAKASLWGNISGLLVSVTSYYFFGLSGIVPAFVLMSIVLYFFTNFYVKKIQIPRIKIENREALKQGMSNLKLGLYIVSVSILTTASMFAVRSFLTHKLDLDAVGIFSAAWTITIAYPALILQSMGSDFFPRLCSVSDSNENIKRLVNEQTYVALVIIIPVVVIMMLFSKYVLLFFYSSEFYAASSLLQWQIVGGFFKVFSWPLAFIMLAKGKGAYHLFAEIVFYVLYLGSGYILFSKYGLEGFGIAYLFAYIIYWLTVLIIGIKLSAFKWSNQNIRMFLVGIIFIILSILVQRITTDYQIIISIFIAILATLYAFFMLNKVFNIKELIDKIVNRFSR